MVSYSSYGLIMDVRTKVVLSDSGNGVSASYSTVVFVRGRVLLLLVVVEAWHNRRTCGKMGQHARCVTSGKFGCGKTRFTSYPVV